MTREPDGEAAACKAVEVGSTPTCVFGEPCIMRAAAVIRGGGARDDQVVAKGSYAAACGVRKTSCVVSVLLSP